MTKHRRDDYRFGRDFSMDQQRFTPRHQQDWDDERYSQDMSGMEGQYPRERWDMREQERGYGDWNQGRRNENSWFQRIRDEFNELRNDFNSLIGRKGHQEHQGNIGRRGQHQEFSSFQDNPQLRYGEQGRWQGGRFGEHMGRFGEQGRFGEFGMRGQGQYDQDFGPMGRGYGMSQGYGQNIGLGQGFGSDRGFGMSQGYGLSQGGYGQNISQQDLSREQLRNRGPKGFQRSDERLKDEICERLVQNVNADLSEVEVKVQNGDVTLMGSVQDKHLKRVLEDIAESVLGVKDVNNQLRISRTMGTSQTEGTQQSSNISGGTSSAQRTNPPRTRNDAE
jgi:hypothetical protein